MASLRNNANINMMEVQSSNALPGEGELLKEVSATK